MKRRKQTSERPVSTAPIVRELEKALRKLRTMRKKASPEQLEAIDLQIKILEWIEIPLEDIWEC